MIPYSIITNRPTVATAIDAFAQVKQFAANVARIGFDPVTGKPLGMPVESPRTNLFLNPLAPATQDIALPSGTYTISLVGPGSAVLSGATTATVTQGPGHTFTGSGTLTVTIVGSPLAVQVESGAFATSIAIGSRAAEFVTLQSQGQLHPTRGTFVIGFVYSEKGSATRHIFTRANASAGRLSARLNPSGDMLLQIGTSDDITIAKPSGNLFRSVGITWDGTDASYCTDRTTVASVERSPAQGSEQFGDFFLGSNGVGNFFNDFIRPVIYIPATVTAAELKRLVDACAI